MHWLRPSEARPINAPAIAPAAPPMIAPSTLFPDASAPTAAPPAPPIAAPCSVGVQAETAIANGTKRINFFMGLSKMALHRDNSPRGDLFRAMNARDAPL